MKQKCTYLLPFLILGCLLCAHWASGQVTQVTTTKTKSVSQTSSGVATGESQSLTMTLGEHKFSKALPFDEPFLIKCTLGAKDQIDQILGIDCWFDVKKDSINNLQVNKNPSKFLGHHLYGDFDPDNKLFNITVPRLKHSTNYYFVFKIRRKLDDSLIKTFSESINPFISKTIKDATNDGTKEINDDKFDKLLVTVENYTTTVLAAKGLTINFNLLDKDYHSALLKSLQDIVEMYFNSTSDVVAINSKIKQLLVRKDSLYAFEVNYEHTPFSSVSDSTIRDSNIRALKKVFPLFSPVYKYPKGSDAMDDKKATAYLAACDSLKSKLNTLLPDNVKLKPIKKDIEDFTDGIYNKFKIYVNDLKEESATVIDQSTIFIKTFSDQLYSMAYSEGTSTPADFVIRSNLYISADLGVAAIPDIGQMVPYLGTNIYLRPINKTYNLSFSKWDLDQRFSFLVGLSVTTLSKTGYRSDLLGTNFNLITGAGFRIADFVKINSGVVWYGQVNPNPLNSKKLLASSWFISLSFDINVKTVFKGLFNPTQITDLQ